MPGTALQPYRFGQDSNRNESAGRQLESPFCQGSRVVPWDKRFAEPIALEDGR